MISLIANFIEELSIPNFLTSLSLNKYFVHANAKSRSETIYLITSTYTASLISSPPHQFKSHYLSNSFAALNFSNFSEV